MVRYSRGNIGGVHVNYHMGLESYNKELNVDGSNNN